MSGKDSFDWGREQTRFRQSSLPQCKDPRRKMQGVGVEITPGLGMSETSNLGEVSMPARKGFVCARRLLCLLFAFLVVNGVSVFCSVRAQDLADAPLLPCNVSVSFDQRLVMEQWATPGHCDRPERTRVTDQFLGFTCQQRSAETIGCRPFTPRLDSRTFDTAKAFRCVDVAVTDTDGGIEIDRLREWAAPPKQCEWHADAGVLAMEVDFVDRQVCLSAYCIDIQRLSAIGMTRLSHLITSALEELNLKPAASRSKTMNSGDMDLP